MSDRKRLPFIGGPLAGACKWIEDGTDAVTVRVAASTFKEGDCLLDEHFRSIVVYKRVNVAVCGVFFDVFAPDGTSMELICDLLMRAYTNQ